jgi:hypothetical protein
VVVVVVLVVVVVQSLLLHKLTISLPKMQKFKVKILVLCDVIPCRRVQCPKFQSTAMPLFSSPAVLFEYCGSKILQNVGINSLRDMASYPGSLASSTTPL